MGRRHSREGWEDEFGSGAPSSAGEALRSLLDGPLARNLSDNQIAARAWDRANGDRERAHTTGVFLKKPRVRGAAPVLGVYVDSHAMAYDFGANKDIYLARLANVGYAVNGIDFVVTRQPRRRASATPVPPALEAPPELNPAERREVEELVHDLPEGLREAAARAVEASKRRDKRRGES